MARESTDPSSEISQIIEKKENPEKLEEDGESIEEIAENECAEEEKDEEEIASRTENS